MRREREIFRFDRAGCCGDGVSFFFFFFFFLPPKNKFLKIQRG